MVPKKKGKDNLMLVRLPKTLNGELTLRRLGELSKKYLTDFRDKTGYAFVWPGIMDRLGDQPIDRSQWVIMTKNILRGSRKKSYAEQQKIITKWRKKVSLITKFLRYSNLLFIFYHNTFLI